VAGVCHDFRGIKDDGGDVKAPLFEAGLDRSPEDAISVTVSD